MIPQAPVRDDPVWQEHVAEIKQVFMSKASANPADTAVELSQDGVDELASSIAKRQSLGSGGLSHDEISRTIQGVLVSEASYFDGRYGYEPEQVHVIAEQVSSLYRDRAEATAASYGDELKGSRAHKSAIPADQWLADEYGVLPAHHGERSRPRGKDISR